MDAIYTAPVARQLPSATGIRTAVAALGSFIVVLLAEGVRGEDFERAFASAPGAQFAALPESSKQRALNGGFHP